MSLKVRIAILLAVFLLGALVGARTVRLFDAAAAGRTSEAVTAAITTSVNRQIAARQAQLTREQDRSLRLARDQAGIRAAATDIRLEISHARFEPPADAGICPDPLGSDEFVRLYDRAAKGGGATTNPTATPAR